MSDKVPCKIPRSSGGGAASRQKPPSRLQRRAPASLQISLTPPQWNVAIPLLSPLATSPTSPPRLAAGDRPPPAAAAAPSEQLPPEIKKPPVFKKWQHPAAPFSYELGPRRHSFVPV